METKPFNIVRELYLNKENRNLLKELLKYLNTCVRGITIISLHKGELILGSSVCIECYKTCEAKFYRCVAENLKGVCKSCHLEHYAKYTKCEPYVYYEGVFPCVFFKHSCGRGSRVKSCRMNKEDSLKLFETGTYKGNIIDYINDGYKLDWSLW